MSDSSLQSRLYAQIESSPDRNALAFIDASGKYKWLSFAEVYERAAVRAAALAQIGLSSKQVCLIVLPHSALAAEALLGTILLGAIPLLMAPPLIHGQKSAYSSLMETLIRITRKTKPAIVLLPETMMSMLEQIATGFPRTRFRIAENLPVDVIPAFEKVLPAAEDMAAFQLTSGTTGTPKVCVWQQRNVVAALDNMADGMKLRSDDVCLNWVPLYHDMGLVNNFLTCLTKGVPLAMMDPADFVRKPALWLRGLFETGATITWSPNFGFALAASRIKDSEMDGIRLDHVRAFWNAAERVHLDTIEAFHARFADYGVSLKSLKTNFGCTENVGGATFSDPDDLFLVEQLDETKLREQQIAEVVQHPRSDQTVVSIVESGVACKSIRVAILSPKGKELPEGQVGEVALDTPSRMAGYLEDATATRHALYRNFVRTGDLGYIRNHHLFWVGRVRERITVRGKKLDPSDFERVLFQIDSLRPGCFVVFGVDDPKIGTQKIIVLSEIQDHCVPPHDGVIQSIRNQIFQTLGVTVDEVHLMPKGTLAKTSSGKRRHRHFRKLYKEGKLAKISHL